MTRERPAVELDRVSVRLGGAEVLHDVNAALGRASVTGLVGPNGAGKSTLLRAASGLLPLAGGCVKVDGRSLAGLSRRRVAAAMNLLPQSVSLSFPFPVRDVVAMGRNPHLGRFQGIGPGDRDIIAWAMQQTDVASLAERPVTELSGGERQRVLLARSLATEAPILLLDEPTTSLDIRHQLEILELLERFAEQGKTVVAALHDLNMARRACSQVLLLHHGRVVASGSPQEALSVEHIESTFDVRTTLSPDEKGFSFSLPPRP